MTTTWTNQEQKSGSTSQAWNSTVATWNSAIYEWDGQLAVVWTDDTKH